MQERHRFERELADLDLREREFIAAATEFRGALAQFAAGNDVPANVLTWLSQSPTYVQILNALDAKYVNLNHVKQGPADTGIPMSWGLDWAANDAGVFTKGPKPGRRMISIKLSPLGQGSYFSPHGNPENPSGVAGDLIFLEYPPSHPPNRDKPVTLEERGQWIERIVHESVHAWRHVLGSRRAGDTSFDRIRSGIDDEAKTREWERKIVGQIRQNVPAFAGYRPTTGSVERWAVQRDFFPGQLRRTYLEHFVLNERLFTARTRHPDTDIKKYDEFVAQIELSKRSLDSYLEDSPRFVNPRNGKISVFQQEYPNLRLALRVIDARWRSVKDIAQRDLYRDPVLEKMREAHAKAFFNGLAIYSWLPQT